MAEMFTRNSANISIKRNREEVNGDATVYLSYWGLPESPKTAPFEIVNY